MLPSRGLGMAASLLAAACAAEGGGRIALPVVGGDDGGPAAVVGLLADGQLFCTATMITRRVALTAAHCVAGVPAGAAVEVFFGERIADGGEQRPTAARLQHPDWRFDSLTHDIGLVALVEDGPEAPLPASRQPMTDADIDSEVELVGFGVATEGGQDAGIKRTGVAPIAGVSEMRLALAPGPGATCDGDSGGPVLRAVDGAAAVIGVHSRSDCVSLSLGERVDVHVASFIDPFVAEHPADCAVEPCDGGGCAAGGAAAPLLPVLALLGLRRWRRGCGRPDRRAARAPAGA